ncbi:MAG: glycosyltransferase family 39 protein [Elusimicrobia bacterium]|nr:glycosyltransferase family 39 protein [Elusimicrobiota bacterium]
MGLPKDGTRTGWWLAAALAAVVLVRLAGIRWGLPALFNGDEPHLVNLAVSFGGGSLRPYSFKYPTLWPYLLACAYAVYFLVWSVLGLRRGVADFVGLFGWHPEGFYLIGRLLAAGFSLAALYWLWRAEQDEERPVPWAALLLAFAPVVNEAAHSCKPDMLMFFFACAAWRFALRLFASGERRDCWLCGAMLGLAASSQFTAAPAALLLPLAWALGPRRGPARWLGEGVLCAGAAFFAASPYILLDWRNFWFWASMRSPEALAAMGEWSRWTVARQVGSNLAGFAGAWSAAGAAVLLGLAVLLRARPRRAALLGLPVLAYFLLLSSNPDGGWPRYLLAALPGGALLASEGLALCARWRAPWTGILAAALALGPGLAECALQDRDMRLPDTRQLSRSWVLEHVPQGATLILDQANASPDLAMTREELEELARRCEASGSPRARLFAGMARTHPGGGYRIYRILRSARDLGTFHPKQVELSQADAPMVDLRPGLSAARAVKAGWVVTSSFGAGPGRSAELTAFFAELSAQSRLEASFDPVPGELAGPSLRIYRLAD